METFAELSPSEFFYRNREIAGFTNPSRALYSSVREMVENSLDACELNEIPPSVYVGIEEEEKRDGMEAIYRLEVRDNGGGVPKEEILRAFGSVFYSSKYVHRQSRGTFGLGGTMAMLYGQITAHRPIRVATALRRDGEETAEDVSEFKFVIDVERNEPHVTEKKTLKNRDGWHGTIVEFSLLGNYPRMSHRIVNYMEQTAVVAPYAELIMRDPTGRLYFFRRSTDEVPAPPEVTKPHPYGVDVEALKKLFREEPEDKILLDFMRDKFHRVGIRTARKFLRYASEEHLRFDSDEIMKVKVSDLEMDDVVALSDAMDSFEDFLPPSASVLSPIGEEFLSEGIKKEFDPEFLEVTTRPSSSYGGHPFIVEVGLAYGGDLPGEKDEILLYRYANKIPLLFDEASDVSRKIIDDVNWNYYKRPTDKPLAFFVHVCSTKVPFRSLGKEFIADVEEVRREIDFGIKELLRGLKSFAKKVEKRRAFSKRLETYKKYLPMIVEFSSELADREKPDIEPLMQQVKEKYG